MWIITGLAWMSVGSVLLLALWSFVRFSTRGPRPCLVCGAPLDAQARCARCARCRAASVIRMAAKEYAGSRATREQPPAA